MLCQQPLRNRMCSRLTNRSRTNCRWPRCQDVSSFVVSLMVRRGPLATPPSLLRLAGNNRSSVYLIGNWDTGRRERTDLWCTTT